MKNKLKRVLSMVLAAAMIVSYVPAPVYAEDILDDGNIVVVNETDEGAKVTCEHNVVVDEAKAPTCTEAGLTEGSHCDKCSEVVTAQKEVAAAGHSYVDGKCTVCGEDEVVASSEEEPTTTPTPAPVETPAVPNATVEVLGPRTLAAGGYMVWPSGDDDIDRPLEVVMNFKANETAEQAAAGKYGNWKTDFYLTVTGLANGSITADNCYLAGNYGTFGWIVIPTDGLTIENNVEYPVVSSYDANLTYENICDYVQDFIAAIHIDEAILEANPNMEVKLSLKMTNPENAEDVLTIGDPAVYTVDDLKPEVTEKVKPKATVSVMDPITLAADGYMVWPSGDSTIDRPLEVVMNFKAEDTLEECLAGGYSNWKTDFYLTVTGLASDSITAEDCYLAGNYGEFGWIVIPTDKLTIENGVEYPVVANYDASLNYKDICKSVKDFTAAIHIAPEILEANPNMRVKLVLKMTNPDNEKDVMVIGNEAIFGKADLMSASKPNATVAVKAPVTLPAGEYIVWPSGSNAINRPLEVVMNFKANDTLEAAQASPYAKWKTDFYLKVTGLATDSIKAEKCYLAGNYGEYGWIVIPTDELTIENGVEYPVVSSYDANLTYENICDYVKDFTAAIHIDEAILEANPKMNVQLSLKMTNPNNEKDVLTVGKPAVYTAEDLATAKGPEVNAEHEELEISEDKAIKIEIAASNAFGDAYQEIMSSSDVNEDDKVVIDVVEYEEKTADVANSTNTVTYDITVPEGYKVPEEGLEMTLPVAGNVAKDTEVFVVHSHESTEETTKYVSKAVVDANGCITYLNKVGFSEFTVTENGLQAAIDRASNGDTIVLLTDIELAETVTVPAGKTVTLDLNGKTISQEKACTASYSMIENKGSLTITGNGKISFTDTGAGDSAASWGSYTIHNAGTLVVENGTIENLSAQNIAGNPFAHTALAIFQYSGSTTINGGTISTPNYRSVRLWSGDMTINGGNFEGQVWVQSVNDTAKLTINGGTFAPVWNDGSSVFVGNVTQQDVHHKAELNVTGGTFTTKIGCNDADKVTGVKIEGGIFTETAKNGTNTGLIAEGFEFKENSDGTYGVEAAPAVTYVAQIGEEKYETLEAAFAAANNATGEVTITLLADIAFESSLADAGKGVFNINDGKKVILDLNGKKIDVTDNSAGNFSVFYNYGEFTLKNGTVNLTATNDRGWNAASSIVTNRGGEFTLVSGTYKHLGGTAMAYVVDNNANSFGDATTTINGGTLTSTYIAIRNRMDTYGANGGGNGIAKLNVTGGELAGKYVIWGQVSSAGAKGDITISGGTFTAAEGKAAILVDTDSNPVAGGIKTAISGGTFSSAVPAEFCADGFVPADNGNGTYGVKVGSYVAQIGEVKYETLAAAIDAAQSGDTIELLSNVTLTEAVRLENVNLNIAGGYKLTLDDKLSIYGESTLNISCELTDDVILGHNAIIKDSTINGNVFVAGKVIFRGDNTVNMISDYGTLTDYYGTEAPMEWTVENGASLTIAKKARYGLGYGDKVTIYGSIADALAARENLTEDDITFFSHGIVAQESKGWNCDSSMTVKDAYVVIGSNNSFGNKPGNYGGDYTFDFENAVLDSSRITFYEAISKTVFNFKNSDVVTGTFMTRDADSVFNLVNTKLLSTTTTNGNDEGNYHAGTLNLTGSSLTYSAPWKLENGTVKLDTASAITAPSITGNGTFTIDASALTSGEVTVITADMSGFTGTIEVVDNEDATYEIADGKVVVKLLPKVAEVDGVQYTTLEAAFAAANKATEAVTITLLADIVTSETFAVAAGKVVTLDLNGKTVSMVYTEKAVKNHTMISNSGDLTIVDSGSAGKLSYTYAGENIGTSYSVNTITSNPGSVLTVKSGTIENRTYDNSVIAYAIDGLTNGGSGDVTVNIEGGTITSLRQAVRIFANSTTNTGTLNITRGDITGRVIVQNASAKANKAALSITGGTFTPNEYKTDVLYVGGSESATIDIDATVSGGTFNGAISDTNVKGFISGGTFATDVTEYCALGLKAEKNSDGTYGIVERVLKGEGTEANPYLIETTDDLIFFRDSVNAGETKYNADGVYVALADDIDLEGIDWSVNIGDDCNVTFKGIFDGDDYTISNLNCTETAQKSDGYICTGLFGAIGGNAVIKNLTVENATINTGDFTGNNAGVVVGFAWAPKGSIENVTVKGDIKVDAKNVYGVGVILGYNYSSNGFEIKDCYVNAKDGSYINAISGAGAIVGYSAGEIEISDCTVRNMDITAKGLIGGLVGVATAGTLTGNTVRNVDLTTTGEFWKNSAAVAVGTLASNNITVSDLTAKYVTANGNPTTVVVGSKYAEQPTAVVESIEAKIGDVYYQTAAIAIEKAASGETVELLSNVTTAITLNKDVVLDLGAYTATVDIADVAATVKGAEGAAVTTSLEGYAVLYSNGVYSVAKPVAAIGDVQYTTLEAAIEAATIGQTVRLLTDVEEIEVSINKGITLDLNGYKLTADYVVAFAGNYIVDSSANSTGLLVVDKDNMALMSLNPENAQLPVWNEADGYKFLAIKDQQRFNGAVTEDEFIYEFRPGNALLSSLMNNGADNNGLKIKVRLSWDDDSGVTGSKDFAFSDELIGSAYTNNKLLRLTATGFKSYLDKNLKVSYIVEAGKLSIESTPMDINP